METKTLVQVYIYQQTLSKYITKSTKERKKETKKIYIPIY